MTMWVLLLVIGCFVGEISSLVIGYAEMCNFTEQCFDHRMMCAANDNNVSICMCDRFHEWNGTSVGCVPKYDVNTLIKMLMIEYNAAEKVERESDRIFAGSQIAGYFVASVGIAITLSVALYCFIIRKKDSRLKTEIREIRERVEAAKRQNHRPFT